MALVRLTTEDAEPFDVAEAKKQLEEDLVDENNDEYIESRLIPTVREAAEERTGYVLVPSTYRLSLDCFPELILLEVRPVTSVTSVKYYDSDGTLQTLSPSDYEVDTDSVPARIVPAYGKIWPSTRYGKPGAVRVEFAAGFSSPDDIPAPVVQWMKLALTDLYENRARSSERPVVPNGFAEELLTFGHTLWRP